MSDVDLEQLNDMQLDVLKEIGNIPSAEKFTSMRLMIT